MPKRILLIDDEDLVIRSVKKLFEKEGFGVVIARNGEEAIELVKTEEVDLIVCDIRMPGKGGVETIRQIKENRAREGKADLAFIFLTGYADDDLESQERGLKPGAIVYKPFDAFRLLEIVRQILAKETKK